MKPDMCSPEETYAKAVEAIENVLFTKKNGKSRIEREIETAFFKGVGRWLIGGGIILIFSVAGVYYQVQANSSAIHEGGRYTQEEADVDNTNFQRQINEINRRFDIFDKKLDTIIQQTR